METKIELSDKLRTFLEHKGLMAQFEYNCLHHSAPVAEHLAKDYITKDLWNAFTWQETPEGGIFWNDITTEFESI